MRNAYKLLLIVGVIALIAFSWFYFDSNSELFKGQLVNQSESEQSVMRTTPGESKPNLKADLNIEEKSEDSLTVEAVISNVGAGSLSGETPFVYSLYLNDNKVFTNTDSYTTMESGDSFSFIYEISQFVDSDGQLQNLPPQGEIKFVVDEELVIDEVANNNDNKSNNVATINYEL